MTRDNKIDWARQISVHDLTREGINLRMVKQVSALLMKTNQRGKDVLDRIQDLYYGQSDTVIIACSDYDAILDDKNLPKDVKKALVIIKNQIVWLTHTHIEIHRRLLAILIWVRKREIPWSWVFKRELDIVLSLRKTIWISLGWMLIRLAKRDDQLNINDLERLAGNLEKEAEETHRVPIKNLMLKLRNTTELQSI